VTILSRLSRADTKQRAIELLDMVGGKRTRITLRVCLLLLLSAHTRLAIITFT
jgi:hypothetical protein